MADAGLMVLVRGLLVLVAINMDGLVCTGGSGGRVAGTAQLLWARLSSCVGVLMCFRANRHAGARLMLLTGSELLPLPDKVGWLAVRCRHQMVSTDRCTLVFFSAWVCCHWLA